MGFSVLHLLILILVEAIWIVPLYWLLGRVGWSRAWAFVALIPIGGLVLLWAIAFGRWRVKDALDA